MLKLLALGDGITDQFNFLIAFLFAKFSTIKNML